MTSLSPGAAGGHSPIGPQHDAKTYKTAPGVLLIMTSQTKILLIIGAAITGGLLLIGAAVPAAARKWVYAVTMAFRAITPTQVSSIQHIVKAFQRYGDGDQRKLAYIIALAYHESRLQPIREIRARPGTQIYEIQNRYWPSGYYGRGFVQITWRDNYTKFSPIVGVDLVANPDAALRPDVAAKIIVIGMMQGLFTGKKLGDYISGSREDYYHARRTVGAIMVAGQDTAALIVSHLKKIVSHL